MSHTRSSQQDTEIPNNWNHGYTNLENTVDAQFLLAMSRAPWLLRKFFRRRTEPEACEIVGDIIRRTTTDDRTYNELIEEFNGFIRTKNVKYLLKLYTKNKELCKILQLENNASQHCSICNLIY